MKTFFFFLRDLFAAAFALLVLLLIVSFFTGCSRSALLFRGTGDIDYYYNGSMSPGLPNNLGDQHKH